jgi:hypothetical protein
MHHPDTEPTSLCSKTLMLCEKKKKKKKKKYCVLSGKHQTPNL